MKVIRYRTKPERAEENARLIERVFAELRAASPQGLRYLVLRLGDGGFVHLVTAETEEGTSPLTRLPAFKAFSGGVAERCLEPPQTSEATIIGDYHMLGA
jgi:hypothetical protein